MPSLRKSLALSFAERYSNLIISTLSVVVLARLLTPAEIGIYSVGAAIMTMAHVLRDFGVGNYLIQEKDLTSERIRTALGVALLVAWSMAAILFGLSGPLAGFYHEPGLQDMLIILSCTFVVIPFTSPVLALLRRDMAFGALYVIGIANALVHAVTTITLAVLGFSFMSLAWGTLAGTITTALVAALYRPRDAWVLPSFSEWRRVAGFGGLSSAADLASQVGMAAPDLILGRLLGFASVGLFSRARGVMQMFNRTVMHAVMPVLTPAFAARHRAGEDLLVPYLKGLSYVTVLAWPFYIFVGVMAYPIIRILFGDQWDGAVAIVQALCLAGITRPLFYFVPPLLMALGKIRIIFLLAAVTNVVFVFLFFIGSLHSLEIAALSSSVSCLLYFGLSLYFLRDVIGLSVRDVLKSVSKSFNIALVSALVPCALFVGMDFGPQNIWPPLLLGLIGTAGAWTGAVFAFRHPIRDEMMGFARWATRALVP